MRIEPARPSDFGEIRHLDDHVPTLRLRECIGNGRVYVLRRENAIIGVLRYSLFWQTIPFLELLYLDAAYRGKGFGTQMMREWESEMRDAGYRYAMVSTQADETAWQFYEKLGYCKVGGFFPPEQDAEEWIYRKEIAESE